MSQTTLAVLGISSGALNLLSLIPYVKSIRQGKTKPERASWWIWTWLMVVAFWAQAAAGATWSLILTGSFLAGNIVVALLSLSHGYGRFRQRDMMALCLAVVGVIIWKATNRPLLALIIVILVDISGDWLTVEKSWRAPYSENLLAWFMIGVSSTLGLLSVGNSDAARTIFPAYVTISVWLMVGTFAYRRRWRSQKIKAGLRT